MSGRSNFESLSSDVTTFDRHVKCYISKIKSVSRSPKKRIEYYEKEIIKYMTNNDIKVYEHSDGIIELL